MTLAAGAEASAGVRCARVAWPGPAATAEISGELLMVWGRQDPHVPDEGRALIQTRLRETQRRFTWHEFNAAHAFLRDEGPRYDPALALLSYRLMIDLFSRPE